MWWEPRTEMTSSDEGSQGRLTEVQISEVSLGGWLWFCQAGSGAQGCMASSMHSAE